MSWGGVVIISTATVLSTGRSGFRISVEPRDFFLYSKMSGQVPGLTQPLHGYKDSFPGAKWLECEDNHWPPSNAEVRNDWSYTSTPPVGLHGMDRENFTFYLACQRMKSR